MDTIGGDLDFRQLGKPDMPKVDDVVVHGYHDEMVRFRSRSPITT
jgi:hypothetical protein